MQQVYNSRGVALYQAEAIAALTALAADGTQFDALITDPPYASGGLHLGTKSQSTRTKYLQTETVRTHHSFEGDARSQLGWLAWCALWLNLCRRMLAPSAPVLMFCDWRQIAAAVQAMECGGFIHRGVVVWDKENARPMHDGFRAQSEFVVVGSNGKRPAKSPASVYQPGVFRHKTPAANARRHQTQKPVPLLQDLMRIVPAGGHVLDPFAGSGSTLMAARETGHAATGIEEQPDIAAHAAEWLSTGQPDE